jgi:IclR family KDG regulon transcriptional repressor
MKAKSSVPSLLRGIRVLETLARDPYEMNLSELSQNLSVPRASLWRILRLLSDEEYVIFDRIRRTYRLGFKFMYMGSVLLSGSHFRSQSRDLLMKLAEKTGETAELDMRVRNQLVIVEQVPGSNAVYSYSYPGSVMPYFHATAPGKVYLAHIHKEKLVRVMKKIGFPKLTQYTIQNFPELEKEIEKVKIDGYAVDIEEMRVGVGRIAAPIYSPSNEIVACVAIVCPSFRLNDRNKRSEYGRCVKEIAEQMTEDYAKDH